MGGVAVKAQGACQDNGPCITRRGVRGRHRNTVPKPLKIPDEVPEESEAKSAPLISSRQSSFSTLTPLNLLPLPEPLPHLDFETDTDTEGCGETGTLFDDADTDQVKVMTSSQTNLSDFSNYLGISQGEDDDDGSVTVVDSDTFTRTNSVDDLYGWEAELDRKMQCRVTNTDSMCTCHCRYQKTDSGKRNILYRVFSSARRVNSGF
ncbi:hypothetical protein AAE478_006028 [Parahypoxylon ruwenzoriense]